MIIQRLFSDKNRKTAENAAIATGSGVVLGSAGVQGKVLKNILDKTAKKVGGKHVGLGIKVEKTVTRPRTLTNVILGPEADLMDYRLAELEANKQAKMKAERGIEMAKRTIKRNKTLKNAGKIQLAGLAIAGAGIGSKKLANKKKDKKVEEKL